MDRLEDCQPEALLSSLPPAPSSSSSWRAGRSVWWTWWGCSSWSSTRQWSRWALFLLMVCDCDNARPQRCNQHCRGGNSGWHCDQELPIDELHQGDEAEAKAGSYQAASLGEKSHLKNLKCSKLHWVAFFCQDVKFIYLLGCGCTLRHVKIVALSSFMANLTNIWQWPNNYWLKFTQDRETTRVYSVVVGCPK